MSDLYVKAQQQNVSRATDGQWTALRGLRDGSVITVPWFQALVLEGRVFSAMAPLVIHGTALTIMATYADTSKTLYADIPDGTAALCLQGQLEFQATGGAVVNAYLFTSGTLNGTGGSETAVTPVNLRLDAPIATAATVAHTGTSEADNVSAAAGIVLLASFSTSQDFDATSIEPNVLRYEAARVGVTPVLVDAASINVVGFTTTSGTGRAFLTWAELPESAFT